MEAKEIKDSLEIRKSKVEVVSKIDEARFNRVRFEEETKKMKLDNDLKSLEIERVKAKEGGWNTPIGTLMEVARAWCIDNESTIIGSEPALRSLWDANELEEIKDMILKKARKL